MNIIIQKPHSVIDLITNSSTEIFIINTDKTIDIVKEIFKTLCVSPCDKEWFDSELTISKEEDGNIKIYSFLNSPDWFNEFVKLNFNVIREYD